MRYPGSRNWQKLVEELEGALILDLNAGRLAELTMAIIREEIADGCDKVEVLDFWQEIWAELMCKHNIKPLEEEPDEPA